MIISVKSTAKIEKAQGEMMEVDNTINQIPKKEKGGVLALILGLLSVLILFGALIGVAYYYFVWKKSPNEGQKSEMIRIVPQINQDQNTQVHQLIDQIRIKDGEIKILKDENALLKKQALGLTQRLNYVIKPKAERVVECGDMSLGKWKLPAKCVQNLTLNVAKILQSDKKILVLEVIGIVDENRYRGKSAELKQEGLASFRAKGVIEQLRKNFPNVVTFEGLSEQKPQKRGFAVRAYYVE